MVASEMWLWV